MSDSKNEKLTKGLGLSTDLVDAVKDIVDKKEKIRISAPDQYVDRVNDNMNIDSSSDSELLTEKKNIDESPIRQTAKDVRARERRARYRDSGKQQADSDAKREKITGKERKEYGMSLDDIAKKLKTNDLKRIMKYAEKFRKEEYDDVEEGAVKDAARAVAGSAAAAGRTAADKVRSSKTRERYHRARAETHWDAGDKEKSYKHQDKASDALMVRRRRVKARGAPLAAFPAGSARRNEEVEDIDETDEMVGEDRRKGPLFQPVGDKEAKARIAHAKQEKKYKNTIGDRRKGPAFQKVSDKEAKARIAHTKQEIKFKKLDKRRNEEVEDIDEAGFDVPSKTKKKNKNGGFQKKAEKITINPTLEKFNVKDYIKNIHTEAMAIEALEWGTDASVNAFKAATPGESPNTRPVADYSMDRPELDEAGARDHYRKFQKKLGATMPAIDKTEYPEIRGLEGPFRFKKGKILYYDPKEGKYYDNKTDIYVDVNPNMI